jgi:hypothetical protein
MAAFLVGLVQLLHHVRGRDLAELGRAYPGPSSRGLGTIAASAVLTVDASVTRRARC